MLTMVSLAFRRDIAGVLCAPFLRPAHLREPIIPNFCTSRHSDQFFHRAASVQPSVLHLFPQVIDDPDNRQDREHRKRPKKNSDQNNTRHPVHPGGFLFVGFLGPWFRHLGGFRFLTAARCPRPGTPWVAHKLPCKDVRVTPGARPIPLPLGLQDRHGVFALQVAAPGPVVLAPRIGDIDRRAIRHRAGHRRRDQRQQKGAEKHQTQ